MNKIKLSKLANINMGQSPKSENYCNNEGIPFLQGNRTFGEKYPEIDIYTKQITKLAKKGEILISVRAPVGDLNIAPVDLCIGRGLSSINSFDGNNEFLYYCLKYNVRNILKQSSGTTYDSINRDILENFELITPKKEDYIKVGEILSKIDNKIELNIKINSELEAMAKTIYDYWFLQFEFPNEGGKPYKSSGGKMVWNEELKIEIPEGWEVKSINTNKLIVGGTPSRSKKEYWDGKIPWLTTSEINNNIIIQTKESITEEGLRNSNAKFIEANTLVMAMYGLGTAGRVGYVIFPFTTNQACCSIECNNLYEKSYLYFFLQSKNKYINSIVTGSIQKNLNKDTIGKLSYVLPKQKILKNTKFNKIIDILIKNTKENQELTSLRDFLLPLLMNGQVGFKEE